MDVVTLDFETFYDAGYTLKTLPTAEYIMTAEFQVIVLSYKINDQPAKWLEGFSASHELEKIDWANTMLVAHNAMFDGGILAWRYKIYPARFFCTMMAARPIITPFTNSMALADCAEFLGIGKKGDEVVKAKGKRRADFTKEELAAYGEYCKNDVELTYKLYKVLTAWYEKNNKDV